jgi:hypothetical protein
LTAGKANYLAIAKVNMCGDVLAGQFFGECTYGGKDGL